MKPLGALFSETSRLHHRFHHTIFDSFGIYRGQPELFFALHREKKPINQTQLARRMNISASTLTRMAQSLEKKGYVTRHADEKDQRNTLIALTPEGNKVHDKIKKKFTETDDKIFRDFTKEEQETLRELLLRIQERLYEELEEKENK